MKLILDISDNPNLREEVLKAVWQNNAWFNLEWAMSYFGKSERTIHRWVNSGKLIKVDWFYYLNKGHGNKY